MNNALLIGLNVLVAALPWALVIPCIRTYRRISAMANERARMADARKAMYDEALLDTTAKTAALRIATACIVDTLDHALEDVGLCDDCRGLLVSEVKRRREHVS